MAMSRKHYREVAEIISGELPLPAARTPEADAERDVLRSVADGLAGMFKRDNSEFNRQRFMDACGL